MNDDYLYRIRIGRSNVVHAASKRFLSRRVAISCCGFMRQVGNTCTELPPETVVSCKVCLQMLDANNQKC